MKHLRRYRLIFPPEHGSWSLMLTPLVMGVGVGLREPDRTAGWAAALCAIAVLALFLIRQPVAAWIRIRRGKGRRQDGPPARFWTGTLAGIGLLCAVGLGALGRGAVFWLAIPAAVVLAATLAVSAASGPRQLGVEIVGSVGLALAAPAGYVAAGPGRLDELAWIVWIVAAAHDVISVLFVRLLIDARHGRATTRQAAWVIGAHGLAVAAMAAGVAGGRVPLIAVSMTGALLVRAIYVAIRQPEIADVRRFGFTEMGLGLAFAVGVVVGYWLRV